MLLSALEQVVRWGPANVAAALRVLTDVVADGASKLGFVVPAAEDRVPHIIGLRVPAGVEGMSVDAMGAHLKRRGIAVAVRAGAIRVSPFLYNTPGDVERLLRALGECCDGRGKQRSKL